MAGGDHLWTMSRVDVRIGISGWTYAPWRGIFYPPGLPQRRELGYVAERLNSVEINGSFYSLQRRSSFEAWAAAVPEDFIFSVKGGRFITHMKKLADVDVPLANFFASGVLARSPFAGSQPVRHSFIRAAHQSSAASLYPLAYNSVSPCSRA